MYLGGGGGGRRPPLCQSCPPPQKKKKIFFKKLSSTAPADTASSCAPLHKFTPVAKFLHIAVPIATDIGALQLEWEVY